jgi:hypothetical protein
VKGRQKTVLPPEIFFKKKSNELTGNLQTMPARTMQIDVGSDMKLRAGNEIPVPIDLPYINQTIYI